MNIIISIYKIIRAFGRKVKEDNVAAFSAQAAFFVIISFFPFFMLFLTLIQHLSIDQNVFLNAIDHLFPDSIDDMVIGMVNEIYTNDSGTIISVTAAVSALWAASRGVLGIVKGLNAVYGIRESRNNFLLRIISAFYTLAFSVILIVSIFILVFGNQLYHWVIAKIPVLSHLALVIISIRTIAGLLILTSFFLMVYMVIPNRTTKIYKEFPGALLAAAGWMGFSYLYSFYIDNMSNYSRTYGSLTAIVLFMLWFYFIMHILFIGGEINVVLSSGDLVYYMRYLLKHRKELKAESKTTNQIYTQEHLKKKLPTDKTIKK
ncbi:YihY/virulence factor BrkB family protein [Anaerocolumna xylanovorans]|uniref:Membrane protein n=1 Tax=Anaerocolumna xylanovorans DSM 12503 TaxID=1121345 RepID=A0A1M7YD09_9FIRM|nr:YihY/virulence factor BrkB family protein [Anaerocolumna xylanovorans]SHO50542.1 membrane protein [Anaerocolumna xylanovorans DSM 12503]